MKLYQPIIFFEIVLSAATPQGRLVEVFERRATLENLDPISLQLVLKMNRLEANDTQVLFDLSLGWPTFVDTPIGRVNLDASSMTVTPRHVTFTSVESSDLIIRFSHDCAFHETSAVKIVPHPALNEFFFGDRANHAAAANSFYYLSPPVPLSAAPLFHGLLSERLEQCRAINGAVRFVISRKPRGVSLRTLLLSSQLDPVIALKIGRALMQTVKSLHTTGIARGFANIGVAHGNFRLDDVFVAFDETGEPSIHLSGFFSSRVSWLDNTSGKALRTRMPPCTQAYLKSPWELIGGENHHYTVRDEIYRVGQLISILLNGLAHEQELKRHAKEETLTQYKLQTPVIALSLSTDHPWLALPLSTEGRSIWVSSLSVINARVFSVDSNSYDDIIRALEVMIFQAAVAYPDFMAAGLGVARGSAPAVIPEVASMDGETDSLSVLAVVASNEPIAQRTGPLFGRGGAFKPVQSKRVIHKPSSSPKKK